MKFVGVRDFRTKSVKIWKNLKNEKNMVITSNGKPVAILTSTSENMLEESLSAIRRAQTREALASIRLEKSYSNDNEISLKEVNSEIQAFRRSKK